MEKEQFIKICNNFIESLLKKNLSIHTIKAYERDLNQLIEFWKIQELNENRNFRLVEILTNFINSLYSNQLKTSSVARKISCINSLKKFVLVNHQLSNEIVFFKRPIIHIQQPDKLTNEQISQLMDKISSEDIPSKYPLRDKAIIEILYATAIRCGELVSVELQHINIKQKSILIQNKSKRERWVFFGSKALKALQNYIDYERTEPKDLREKLFLNHKNQPLTVRSIQRICAMFRQFLQIKEKLTPKILRNSCATHLLDRGAPVQIVQKLLGHKTSVSTERYLHKQNYGNLRKKVK